VSASDVGNLRICIPDVDEQRAIADFLDREIAKVDDLISRQQDLILLLRNEQEAVVRQLVVRHDLSVPKRPSGFYWLGEVPCHWKVLALKRIAKRVVVGIAEASTHAYSDDGIPLIRSANIRPNKLDSRQLLKIEPWFAEKNKSKAVLGDDLLTVRSGVNYGDTAAVPKNLAGSQCFTLLVTSLKPGNVPQYFSYYLNSIVNRTYFEREAWGAAQANLSVPILQMTPVPVPPPSEQGRIVLELDQRLREIEGLRVSLEENERRFQLLRSALISAAVTSSRAHAVRYKQEFDKYIAEKGYTDIKTLVAFSGTVRLDVGDEYTEVGMNSGIREKELPMRFASDEFQVLIVAEKYQTGFDHLLARKRKKEGREEIHDPPRPMDGSDGGDATPSTKVEKASRPLLQLHTWESRSEARLRKSPCPPVWLKTRPGMSRRGPGSTLESTACLLSFF
jgi:restriction endonuclease S subunit